MFYKICAGIFAALAIYWTVHFTDHPPIKTQTYNGKMLLQSKLNGEVRTCQPVAVKNSLGHRGAMFNECSEWAYPNRADFVIID